MAKRPTVKTEKSALSAALDHVVIANTGPANFAPFCRFDVGWLVGYDGIVAAGARCNESLTLAPASDLFRAAVARAGNPISLTAMPDGTLVVKGTSVRAIIPCFEIARLPNVVPDNAFTAVTDSFKAVLIDASKLAAVKSESVIGSAMFVTANTVIVTDGQTIVEGFHGAGLPANFVLPREFADACAKVKYPLTRIGWSEQTLTLWFGDNFWLRTNYYTIEFPDTALIFARMMSECNEYRPVPTMMLQAIETLKPFRDGPALNVTDYGLNTREDHQGASYTFEHWMTHRGMFPTEALKFCAAHGQTISFNAKGAYWYGPVFRGTTSLKGV